MFLLFVLLAFAYGLKNDFVAFTQRFNKSYATEAEYTLRSAIFYQNLAKAESYNRKEGNTIYGVTKFMDLSPQEFRARYMMPKGSIKNKAQEKEFHHIEIGHLKGTLPDAFDWRDKNAVTPIKDQGQCGSCWAFSATEAIESAWFLSGQKLVELAPQQIVDCDKGRGDQGCNGGDTPTAYQYVIAAGGMEKDSDYPYTGEDGTCAFQKSKVVATISNWTYVTTTLNETEMQYKMYAQGPLSICVDASTWQFYIGGVIEHFCSSAPEDLDHCVMITGWDERYDWLDRKVPIWKIRNSWGGDWGYGGWLYVERGYNLCGVADEVTLPLVK